MFRIAKLYARRHGVLLAILVITIVTFLPTFSNGFQMAWDDQWMVMNAQTVGHLDLNHLRYIFTVPFHGQISPINQLMYTLLYKGFGFNPVAFHAASLLLHVMNILLLYHGLDMILRDCTEIAAIRARWILAITTVLFAIHPLQVESVAWISASKIPLSTTFCFGGAILLMRYLRGGRVMCCALALLMQLMAYLSKEQAVVFPLFATLLCFWYGLRLSDKRFWCCMVPFYLLGLASAAHEVFYVSHYDQYVLGETYLWWQRLVFSVYSPVTYFFKWLVPANLNWMYLFPMAIGESMPWWLIPYPVLAALLVLVSWDWLKKPIPLSALLFFLVHLLPVIHIAVLPREAVVADRYLYIPAISLDFMLAYALTGTRALTRHPRSLFVALSVLVLLLCCMSHHRTMDWRDSDTLKNVQVQDNDTNGY